MVLSMKCDGCGDPNPTVHLTEVVNGEVTEVHLCPKCASSKIDELKKPFNMSDFLTELIDIDESGASRPKKLECKNCSMTYAGFKEVGRMGCAQCYDVFSAQLPPLLQRIHGAKRHVGKAAVKQGSDTESLRTKVEDLKTALDRAVKTEEFESAAVIRDQIRELESRLNRNEDN